MINEMMLCVGQGRVVKIMNNHRYWSQITNDFSAWRHHEANRIRHLDLSQKEKTKQMKDLLLKEIGLVHTIDRLRDEAHKKSQEEKLMNQLEMVAELWFEVSSPSSSRSPPSTLSTTTSSTARREMCMCVCVIAHLPCSCLSFLENANSFRDQSNQPFLSSCLNQKPVTRWSTNAVKQPIDASNWTIKQINMMCYPDGTFHLLDQIGTLFFRKR